MKSLFVLCDKQDQPFVDVRTKDYFKMTWAYSRKEEAEDCAKLAKGFAKVIEYRPVKSKE